LNTAPNVPGYVVRPSYYKAMTRRDLLAVTPGLLLLNCSSRPSKKVVEKPAEPVTGLHALYQMYTFARTWAQDLKVIRLSSIAISEVKAEPGKAAAWQVQFASETLGKTRAYTSSVYEESVTLRKGIFADSPGPLSADTHSFVIGAATTDTDKAWEIALAHAQKYAQDHPDMPVSYILEADRTTGGPVWRVIWGLSAASSSFSILIDANSGKYLRTLS
jgi:hypothetical protein